MTNLDMQNLNRATMKHLIEKLEVGMTLFDIRNICEKYMLKNGADSFWYWDIGAFVFAGDETTISVSGKKYKTSERIVRNDDILTVDLRPQNSNIWGDFARTIIVENGKVVDNPENILNNEWRNGVKMESYLHDLLMENANTDMTFEELYYYINSIIPVSYTHLAWRSSRKLSTQLLKSSIKTRHLRMARRLRAGSQVQARPPTAAMCMTPSIRTWMITNNRLPLRPGVQNRGEACIFPAVV